MFKDERRYDVWELIRQHGIRVFAERLTPSILNDAAGRCGLKIGKTPLGLATLVWLGIASALQTASDFATILSVTLKLLQNQEGFYATEIGKAKSNGKRQNRNTTGQGKNKNSKHDPYRNDPTEVTEEAFARARRRMPLAFWMNLMIVLGDAFQEQHHQTLKFRGLRLLAIDGTTIALPNWKKLRDHFGSAKNGHGRQNAQARMVMLQFPLARMPYRYELCSLDQGEVTIARRLSKHLQQNDLLLMDGCFLSYGLLWDIQDRGAFFALPLKRENLKLKRVKSLGRQDEEVCWIPKDSRGQWREQRLEKSIRLRVITYQLPGFRPQKLATNVLCPTAVSRQDWVRLTTDCTVEGKFQPGLCHRRWEIETSYRELKVEQGMEGDLRSRTPESIQYEVAGHMLLYLLVRWMMVEAGAKHGIDPLRLSFKNALRELVNMHQSFITASPRWARVLLQRLLDRIIEHQVPYRPGRSFPRRKKSTNYKTISKKPKPNRNAAKGKVEKEKAAKGKNKKNAKQG